MFSRRVSFVGRVDIRPWTGASVDTHHDCRLLGRGDIHYIASAADAHETGFDFFAFRIRAHSPAHDPPDESILVVEGAMILAFHAFLTKAGFSFALRCELA